MNSLNRLKSEHLLELSRIVISSLPSDTIELTNRQEMATRFEFRTIVELQKTIEILFDYWKKTLFHAKKPALVRSDFEEVGIESKLAEKLAELWLKEGAKIMPKVKALSRSGLAEVNDIHWTLNLERKTRFEGAKREPYINLQFGTSNQGKKCVSLNFEELKQLYVELQDVQKNVDSIFK